MNPINRSLDSGESPEDINPLYRLSEFTMQTVIIPYARKIAMDKEISMDAAIDISFNEYLMECKE
jgi:hypothetical protein